MASLQTVVELIFQGVDNASQTAKSLTRAMSELDGKVQGIAAPFASFADGLLKAEAAALAMATTVGVFAVKEALKFQDSLYLVQKQLGDSGVSIDKARQDIEAFGQTYGINANEVAKSVAGFLAAGYDYETAAKLVETSTQLMIAGELEASFAVDAINKSLAGFRVPANEAADSATKVGDILNKIGDISSGNFEEIVTGFSRISPSAKDAGLSMEETAAIIASLVDIFGSGEVAATALKSGLLSLLTPSNEAEAALAELGVANANSNGELRSSKEILVDLAGRWNTLTDAQKQQTAAIIFGKEQAGAMSAVLGDWAKVQGYVNQLVDENTGAVGSMAREVDGKLELISAKVGKADEAWRQFLENLGARLLNDPTKNLAGVFEAVSQLGDAFKTVANQGGLDPLISLVQRQAGEFASLVSSIAKNLPEAFKNVDFSGLVESLELLGDQVGNLFKTFFGDIDLTTVDGLTRALQFLVDGFETLTVTVTGILVEFQPLIAMLREGVLKFGELDRASQLEFGSFLGAMKLLVDAGTGLGLALVAVGEAGLEMGRVFDVVFGAAKVAANSLQIVFDGLLLAVTSPIALIAKAMVELDDAIRKFKDQENAPFSPMRQDLNEMLGYYESIAENLKRNAEEGRSGLEQIGEGFGIVESASRSAAQEGLAAARDKLLAVGAAAKQAGNDFSGLKDDLADASSAVDDTIKGLSDLKITAPEIDVSEIKELDFSNVFDGLAVSDNIFDPAIEGINAFTNAAEEAGFGTKEFAKSVKAAAEDAAKGATDGKKAMLEWGDAVGKLPDLQPPPGVQKTVGVFQAAGKAAQEMGGAIDGISTAYSSLDGKTVKATGAFAETAKKVNDVVSAQEQFNKVLGGTGNSVEVVASAFNTYLGVLGSSGKLTTDQIIELTKSANDFKIKMEEIASNERIKLIEAKVTLNVAGLEADTRRIEAALDSTVAMFENTGVVMGDLLGAWSGAQDTFDKWKVESWIEEENARRDKLLDTKLRMDEAIIKQLEARTEAMNRGDAIISIKGDGLQPHLESFMWEILKAIQVRASADMQEFLLGV